MQYSLPEAKEGRAKVRCCKRCGKPGYNVHTCPEAVEGLVTLVEDSN